MMSQITFSIDESVKQNLKLRAAKKKTSMTAICAELITKKFGGGEEGAPSEKKTKKKAKRVVQ